ncbi:outer membrane immunogenic protein [Rhizobiales bacterium GAS191]|nr:outer membrane immunogenic protein [Rhizobiales bacterium GAS113]SEC13142.1 outer membrane immunogenic protein [Rhizobiales bacterium GAS188]SED09601.1 outer membrane immunogenic protein [Rhizobiales bacterium GAS191]
MKKFLMATTALAMFGVGAASAADLPSRKGPPIAPVYVPPAFTWTGFYVGVNAGYGWANNSKNNVLPAGAIPIGGFFPTSSSNNGGFVGGGQAGYNYQLTPGQGFVLGAEADIDYVGISKKRNNSVPFTLATTPGTTFFPGTSGSGSSSSGYLGTVRARVGYAFDRFLVYGTGGLAYGDIGRNSNRGLTAVTAAGATSPITGLNLGVPQTAFLGSSSNSSSNIGWTIGGGLEYAVWQNWTVKAEYLYYNLGSKKNNAVLPFVVANRKNSDNDGSIVRVGVNYKFW